MQTVVALISLARLFTSGLAFLAVFLPLLLRSHSIPDAFGKAIPVLLIAMCTFILNDIDDIEGDKINHPNRPLPSNRLLPSSAAVFYFACLTAALFATKLLVPAKCAFLYYVLMILGINYGYVEDHIPDIKSAYVATASAFPPLIVAQLEATDDRYFLVATSAFFFVLGREMLLDFRDRAGDTPSFVGRLSRRSVTFIAYTAQALGILSLAFLAHRAADYAVMVAISTLYLTSLVLWLSEKRAQLVPSIMKAEMYCGLYFLAR